MQVRYEPRRIQPLGPPQAYKTYEVRAPLATHWRPATCAEVDCEHYVNGWRVRVEGLDPAMLNTARTSGRRFVEQRVSETETWLVFEAGQRCFRSATHRLPTGRPELYVVRSGDWRTRPGTTNGHTFRDYRGWLDDFSEHQERLADRLQRG